MAVTMVIGNSDKISMSLLSPGNTLASKMANEYAETTHGRFHLSALFELGLMVLLVTVVTNILARLLIGAMGARKAAWTLSAMNPGTISGEKSRVPACRACA